jgi:hypothetical protein
MFRALLSHHQEALHKRHSVFCVRIMLVRCGSVLQTSHRQLTVHSRNIPNAVCVAPPKDEQVMLETR